MNLIKKNPTLLKITCVILVLLFAYIGILILKMKTAPAF
jgi:hypothetical protein